MNTMKEIQSLWKRIKPLVQVLGGGALIMIAFQTAVSFVVPVKNAQNNSQNNLSASVMNAFDDISLEAKAAYVYDLNKKEVIFALNENDKLPLASITKLMTAFVARDYASESALVTLTRDDISAEGDSGLRVGERWRLGDLLQAMLIISSNDAAHGVARFIGSDGQPVNNDGEQAAARAHFIALMNEKALALGLKQMQFFNESGLDIAGIGSAAATNGGYGSAHDVAQLFAELWKTYPSIIEVTTLPAVRIISQDNIAHILPNTDGAIGKFAGLIASKTGSTNLAGGNLAIIFDRGINDPVVAVVLGSSLQGRFDDMAKLVAAAQK